MVKWGTRGLMTAAVLLSLSAFAKKTGTGLLDLPAAITVHAAERAEAASTAVESSLDTTSRYATVALPEIITPATPAAHLPSAKKPLMARLPIQHMLRGMASWYGKVLQDHLTASGRRFDMNELTAAHRTLPFGTRVRVTDLNTRKTVIVTITDRGVLLPDRAIDLSYAAAQKLGILKAGVARVKLDILTASEALLAESEDAPMPDPAP